MPALSVERLSKRFGRTYALSEIGFTVEPGEMVALIGASGSGKSTLIRHIAGLERGNGGDGRITVEGRVMQQGGKLSPEARAIRRHIGVVFQQFNLIGRLPVLTNVLIGCLGRVPAWRGTLGWFARSEQETAVRALMRVGIAETARRRASTLSGGQQQRAAIARALVQGAKLLIADEPIASLDPASAKRVMEALADINRVDGITVIVSSIRWTTPGSSARARSRCAPARSSMTARPKRSPTPSSARSTERRAKSSCLPAPRPRRSGRGPSPCRWRRRWPRPEFRQGAGS